jgi:predicted carbohydrate-binding protein with CBM5 and CBM33 domain
MPVLSTLRSTLRRVTTVFVVAGVLLATVPATVAQAHGGATDPISRVIGCNNRWSSNYWNPAMKTEDPMCYQAFQADGTALYNPGGNFREGISPNYRAAVPDGQLCSGGRSYNGRYAAFDNPGAWRTTTKPRQFRLTVTDSANHGAARLYVYITKQGFDPLTQRLSWDSIELVTTTTSVQLGQTGLSYYVADVNAGTRTGRHVVYTIWQGHWVNQTYFSCSDVVFTGTNATSTVADEHAQHSEFSTVSRSTSTTPDHDNHAECPLS